MPTQPPREVRLLLEAPDSDRWEAAWARFLEQHSETILATARFLSNDYDAAMDRYRYAVEALRRDGCQRLRAYQADPRSKFSTWLVVVVRRLCRDYERQKYGRHRPGASRQAREALDTRRRLADLLVEQLEHHPEPGASEMDVHRRLELEELRAALVPALRAMSAEDRLLLKLRFVDEVSARRIAEVAMLPSVFHVYRRLNRALTHLRGVLRDRGFDG